MDNVKKLQQAQPPVIEVVTMSTGNSTSLSIECLESLGRAVSKARERNEGTSQLWVRKEYSPDYTHTSPENIIRTLLEALAMDREKLTCEVKKVRRKTALWVVTITSKKA